jgi:hypothetical protein
MRAAQALHLRSCPMLHRRQRSLVLAPLAALLTLVTTTGSALAADPPSPEDDVPGLAPTPPPPPALPVQTERPTSSGFMLGASVDYLSPLLSNLGQGPGTGPGPGVGVHAGYRWKVLYFGAAYQHGFLSGGGEGGHESTPWNGLAASTDYFGLDIDTVTKPDAVLSFVTHFSAGYRVVNVTSTCCYSPAVATSQNAGFDFLLAGVGLQINAGGWLRLQPEVSLSLGPAAIASIGLTAFFDVGSPVGSQGPVQVAKGR